MCGICGIFRSNLDPVDPLRVKRMRDAMSYRGPDGVGLTYGPGYALGHRRLSIIDLSDNGLQPMANEDGTVEVVFNGAIYNFAELRRDLCHKGHRFRSHTDTEVLVHGYEEWGLESLLSRIRGMYAFAIVNLATHTIHLARDPLGKKPLFFWLRNGDLVFASSARALALALDATPEIDPIGVDQLLSDLYIPGPRSIFEGVEKLLPGHALSVGRNGQRKDLIHWSPDFLHPEEGVSDEEWLERIEHSLEISVNRRLIADVPVGILLSGGVDSSLVTATAAKIAGRVQTFSVATDDPAMDESRFAEAVAKRYDTVHHVLKVASDFRNNLVRLVSSMGEPLADASAANVLAIAQQARQFVTVILTGDGGDEAFGGYNHHLAYYLAQRLRRFLPGPLKMPVALLGDTLRYSSGTIRRAGTLCRLTALPLEQTLFSINSMMAPSVRPSFYSPEFRQRIGENRHNLHYLGVLPDNSHGQDVDRVMQAQLLTILPDDYLAKVDGATMGVSVEARSPFLDINVMELAMRIPADARFRGGKAKSLLRRLALRYVPAECVQRSKQGFAVPIGKWLRTDWSDLVEDFVLGPQVEQRGWFQRSALEQVVREHRGGLDHAYLLWGIIVLELWVRLAQQKESQPDESTLTVGISSRT
jgi:asparagine synthase (glutamine-hydrolysing)